jgi:hypothetical protein
MKASLGTILFALALNFNGLAQAQGSKADASEDTELTARRYIESFKQSGVPTPSGVVAAVEKAKLSNKIADWEFAARIANSYANVVGELKSHYSKLHTRSAQYTRYGNEDYLNKAVEYEEIQNQYLQTRNDAYLSQSELYLQAGNKASALSFAMTAMSLSGASPNTRAEEIMRRIVEYK